MPHGSAAAASETLAIVAHLQPVTKADIESLRGVDVTSVLGTLLDRRFICEAGRREATGRPTEYQMTPFLESFGLRSVDELLPVDLAVVPAELALPTLAEREESTTSP